MPGVPPACSREGISHETHRPRGRGVARARHRGPSRPIRGRPWQHRHADHSRRQEVRIYENPDGTWEQHRDAGVFKGTYTWKADHTACFTQFDPAPTDPSHTTNCNDIKGEHKLGDTWSEPLPNGGGSITMSISAGR
jgi:hypothetical protein